MYADWCKGKDGYCLLIGNNIVISDKKPSGVYLNLLKKLDPLPKPRFGKIKLLFFEITEKCNFSCIHCYNKPFRKTSTISVDDFREALEKLSEKYTFAHIQITGGEPTLVNDLPKFIKIASEYGKVQIFTNGYVFRKLPKETTVRVSFYSFIREKYRKITGIDAGDVVLKNIEKYSKNYRTLIDVPIIPGINEDEYPFIKTYFEAKEIPVKGNYIIAYGSGKDLKKKVRYLYLGKPLETWIWSKYYDPCWATHLTVDTKLNVFPCIFAREYFLGNLRTDSIKKIFENHKKICELFRPDNLKECKSCELRYACSRCRPRAKSFGLMEIKEAGCPKNTTH